MSSFFSNWVWLPCKGGQVNLELLKCCEICKVKSANRAFSRSIDSSHSVIFSCRIISHLKHCWPIFPKCCLLGSNTVGRAKFCPSQMTRNNEDIYVTYSLSFICCEARTFALCIPSCCPSIRWDNSVTAYSEGLVSSQSHDKCTDSETARGLMSHPPRPVRQWWLEAAKDPREVEKGLQCQKNQMCKMCKMYCLFNSLMDTFERSLATGCSQGTSGKRVTNSNQFFVWGEGEPALKQTRAVPPQVHLLGSWSLHHCSRCKPLALCGYSLNLQVSQLHTAASRTAKCQYKQSKKTKLKTPATWIFEWCASNVTVLIFKWQKLAWSDLLSNKAERMPLPNASQKMKVQQGEKNKTKNSQAQA